MGAMVGKSDFGEAVAEALKGIKDRYVEQAATPTDSDKSVKEQVVRDLDKLQDIRRKGERF